jgi:predicted SnoaL-like aldol condensation-catalyzing enzyme
MDYMKNLLLLFLFMTSLADVFGQQDSLQTKDQTTMNKEIARNFYQDLWFTNNTDKYGEYVADEYVVHDIFERKNLVEQAVVQKEIADRFWNNGELRGKIDYQIAEGDLVATRWHASFKSRTLMGKVFGMEELAIINVFRIKDGEIVEIWNHRHDIETNQTMRFTFKGLLIGLLIALIPTVIAFRLRRKLKRMSK